jgi:hypothetical protein
MKFRKRPVVIEAYRIGWILDSVKFNWKDLPEWVQDAYDEGRITFYDHGIDIHTLEGVMFGPSDHMLIQGVEGEIYACEPNIFGKTYEPVNE